MWSSLYILIDIYGWQWHGHNCNVFLNLGLSWIYGWRAKFIKFTSSNTERWLLFLRYMITLCEAMPWTSSSITYQLVEGIGGSSDTPVHSRRASLCCGHLLWVGLWHLSSQCGGGNKGLVLGCCILAPWNLSKDVDFTLVDTATV